jgi:hypothetical protein
MQSDSATKNNLMIVIKNIMTSVVTLELDASSVQWLQHRLVATYNFLTLLSSPTYVMGFRV